MKRTLDALCRILILTACALPVLSSSAAAQTEDRGPAFDLFGGYLRSTGSVDGHSKDFGLRGSYRFSDTWAVEGALAKVDESGQLWFGDLSAKAYLVDTSRFEIYALGGPGVFRAKFDGEASNQAAVHFGIGAEIGLGARAYLRPEIRGRWATDELNWDAGIAEYSLGIGWKF
jgi:opacity protein-like surface antigen